MLLALQPIEQDEKLTHEVTLYPYSYYMYLEFNTYNIVIDDGEGEEDLDP